MKQHDTKESVADRHPAGARHTDPAWAAPAAAARHEAATTSAPPDSPRMVRQAAQLKRLRGGEPASEATGAATSTDAGPARGGLPAQLRAGLEAMSGQDLGDVRVHYGSSRPAQLEAHAYAQGRDIHLAPGQEQHLPHEAWHVVQQAQGRVKPTTTMGGGVPVNDHGSLEREADVMGARAQNAAPVQRKGRIDTSKIADEKKRLEVEAEIKRLKDTKRAQKRDKVATWAATPDTSEDQGIARDNAYNDDIKRIRSTHELAMTALSKTHDLPLISGADYYGAQVEGSRVFRRPDNGKEYVKDRRGTFVPRYVRRELNDHDDTSADLQPTPKTYGDLKEWKGIPVPTHADDVGTTRALRGADISWDHREFAQQAMGGGNNQLAFSHTSTHRPILSNKHFSFGEQEPDEVDKPPKPRHKGAMITDLAELQTDDIGAQWEIDPTTGHKVPLDTSKLATVAKTNPEKRKEAADKVQMSGYRNMEVVTRWIPASGVVDHGLEGWDTQEGPRQDYFVGGESARGNAFGTWRDGQSRANHDEDLEKERLAKEAEAAKLKESETGTTGK